MRPFEELSSWNDFLGYPLLGIQYHDIYCPSHFSYKHTLCLPDWTRAKRIKGYAICPMEHGFKSHGTWNTHRKVCCTTPHIARFTNIQLVGRAKGWCTLCECTVPPPLVVKHASTIQPIPHSFPFIAHHKFCSFAHLLLSSFALATPRFTPVSSWSQQGCWARSWAKSQCLFALSSRATWCGHWSACALH